jgi:FixJ family two-component response regulator
MAQLCPSPALVVVVDDDHGVCCAISSLVRSAGYRCASFPSAEAFLESATIRDIGCLVLDVWLPGMNGLALQRALEEMCCDVPIIYVTATADCTLGEGALRRGAVAFLDKPFDGGVLLHAIGNALDEFRPNSRSVSLRADRQPS